MKQIAWTLSIAALPVVVAGCSALPERTSPAGLESPATAFTAPVPTPRIEMQPDAKAIRSVRPLTAESELPDYLLYAAANNPGLEAAFNRWRAAVARIPQATALPDPRFSFSHYLQEVETRVGPQQRSFSISQMFPWFGTLDIQGQVAFEAAQSARQQYEALRLSLFFEVQDAYYEHYYLARSIEIAEENVQLLTHMEQVARSRYSTATGTHPDVIRAQVELGKLRDLLNSLRDQRSSILARLNAALNRPLSANLAAPANIEVNAPEFLNEEVLLTLLEQSPTLRSLDHQVLAQRHRIELAKKQYYPDLTFGLGFIETGGAVAGHPDDSGKDPVIASLSLNIPLWRDKYDAAVREARREHRAALLARTDRENTLGSALETALYQYRDAERKVDLYGDALLPKAREALEVTESDYRAGRSTFTDLVDAQRVLLEFALAYERSTANLAQSLARIESLIGREVPPAEAPGRPSDISPTQSP